MPLKEPESCLHSELLDKGQVRLPRKIRQALHLAQGDSVSYEIVPHHDAVILRRAERPTTTPSTSPFPTPSTSGSPRRTWSPSRTSARTRARRRTIRTRFRSILHCKSPVFSFESLTRQASQRSMISATIVVQASSPHNSAKWSSVRAGSPHHKGAPAIAATARKSIKVQRCDGERCDG